jgi:hypothetical protein
MANKIYQFDPNIYPRLLWIAVGVDYACIKDYFATDIPDLDESELAGVYNARTEKPKKRGGILIRFKSKKEMTADIIAHESAHAALEIFDYIGCVADPKNQEPFAYLVGWIAGCCEKVKTGKFEDNA